MAGIRSLQIVSFNRDGAPAPRDQLSQEKRNGGRPHTRTRLGVTPKALRNAVVKLEMLL